jgi:hypothetical protein
MLNFHNFAHYAAIAKIACYIALKHHNVIVISNIASNFLFVYAASKHMVRVWSKQTYDANFNC